MPNAEPSPDEAMADGPGPRMAMDVYVPVRDAGIWRGPTAAHRGPHPAPPASTPASAAPVAPPVLARDLYLVTPSIRPAGLSLPPFRRPAAPTAVG